MLIKNRSIYYLQNLGSKKCFRNLIDLLSSRNWVIVHFVSEVEENSLNQLIRNTLVSDWD